MVGFWWGFACGAMALSALASGVFWGMGRAACWFVEQDRVDEQTYKRDQFGPKQ